MEVMFSAIMGELASRSISFLLDKYLKQTKSPSEEERLQSLQQLLLRIRIIVDEAEDRRITNHAMLHQLSILKEEMYRGYYIADSFSCRAHGEDRTKVHQISQSFAPSKFNPAKRVCLYRCRNQNTQAELLEQLHGSIENTIKNVSEFVVFLNRCPPLNRQPYSMYLLLNNCMFNRQMEMQHIMNFLLQAEITPDAEDPGVLPIIGPGRVGKSTLIEHACDDERVRNHFFQIVCFSGDDLRDASVVTLRDRGTIKHQNHGMDGGKTLIIIELVLDIDDCVWRKLFSAAKSCIASGSKIIIASRSEKIARLGTTQALIIQFFTQEAYWYFFKVRTFGSTNADDHPKLAAIAMDMAREMDGCFMGANVLSRLLKAKFNPHFWSMALAGIREYKHKNELSGLLKANCSPHLWHMALRIIRNYKKKNLLLHRVCFLVDLWQLVEPSYVRRVNKTSSEYIVILEDYQTCSSQSEDETPKMTVEDLFFGSVRPQGRFKVLAWRSHLPPHYNYMLNCETRRPRRISR